MTKTSNSTVRRGYVDYSGGQLHYRTAGSMIAPRLVLLHQSPSGSIMFEPLMAALRDRFYLIAPDLPGFGQSDPPADEASVTGYAIAVAELLEALGVERCAVFGHHTGAAVAAQLAYDLPHKVDALILSGPPLLDADQRATLPSRAAPFALDEEGLHLQKMWQRIRDKDVDVPLPLTQRETLAALQAGDSYAASYGAVVAHDFAALLPKIPCPALVFAGERDVLHSAVAPTVAALPRGRSAALSGSVSGYACDTAVGQVETLINDFCLEHQAGLPPTRGQ